MRSDLDTIRSTPASKRTLLIVDDEEGPRQSLWAIFKDAYEILLAENGKMALELAREHSIDAAVLDIRMPDMSGTELLDRLKQMDSKIEVVMLTAYQTVDTARQALKFGACEYLSKPFEIATMTAAVANAMERRAVAEQIHSNTQLLRELQFEMENQRLQNELVRTKGEIYASILHDINNPLTAISGLIDMMHRQVADATQVEGANLSKLRTRLSQINRQLSSCINMSRRYLSFLKPDAAADPRVSVNQALADVEELLQHNPGLKHNRLTVQLLAKDATTAVNGIDLVQILLNLADNALRCTATPHKVEILSRILTGSVNEKECTNTATSHFFSGDKFKNEAPMVELSVVDDGGGIPREFIHRLFDPYFTKRSNGQGTGLGLSIVRRLIIQAQGALFLRSEVGQNTVFKLYFAIRPEEGAVINTCPI